MTENRSTLIIVDPTVADYAILLQGLKADTEVLLLNPLQDGIAQITQFLASRRCLTNLQIVSHGSPGSLHLGTGRLNADSLSRYADWLGQWSASFCPGGDVLLWGCSVAAGSEGRSFLKQFADLTRLNIAASTNLTGSADRGGDWILEASVGKVTAPIAFSAQAISAYAGTLNTFNVGSYTDLVQAITDANTVRDDGVVDVINIVNSFDIAGPVPKIESNVRIVGNSRTINGRGQPVFQVDNRLANAAVQIEDLTIDSGLARGADATVAGQVGGAGQGGGLLIEAGNVSLMRVGFQNNRAIGGRGGNAPGATGGQGGEGRGGAIALLTGSLRLTSVTFNGNSVIGGSGGTGMMAGAIGSASGSALFVNSGATVITEGDPAYNGNTVASPPGAIVKVDIPTASIVPATGALLTAANQVAYTVSFTSPVTGVDVSDFEVTGTIADAAVLPTITGSGTTYTVTLSTGTALTGTVGLRLRDDDSIRSTVATSIGNIVVPLGGTGSNNGTTLGAAYTINRTPPTALSIARLPNVPTRTAAASVTYRVVFSDDVSGVTIDDFQPTTPGGITGASVTEVQAISPNTYDVLVNTGTGSGALGLVLLDNDSIQNTLGVLLGGAGMGNGNFANSQTYAIDKIPPAVTGISAATLNPVNLTSVDFTIGFTQPVVGLDISDFALATAGVSNAQIVGITEINPTTYRISVSTGTGDGSIGLNLIDNDSIRNELGVPLGEAGAGNGNAIGQVYTIIKSAPIVSAIVPANPSPTAAATVNYTVTFSQDVQGVEVGSFALQGIPDAQIIGVSGAGASYTVSVNTGTGNGSLSLNLLDTDTIRNSVGTPLGGVGVGNGNFVGGAYTVNKIPPRVASITRLQTNPLNASTASFAVIFNDPVSRVDAADFSLATTGVTAASIASVTRVNDSFYEVAINTGSGNGTIGLNLLDNDSIVNALGVTLGGAGVGNGNFAGEVYTIDRANPTATILPVTPQTRREPVSAITIQFNEAIAGLDLGDLRLTRDGNPINLGRATLTSADGISWTLGNLRRLTNTEGSYRLSLSATDTGITDLAGNPLAANVADQWTNLTTVKVCDPGITRRGTRDADILDGTENSDTLIGLAGDDVLTGFDCDDRLDGGRGNDRLDGGVDDDLLLGGLGNDILIGGTGQDRLTGGAGADRIVFAGSSQAAALATSLANAPDRVRRFDQTQGDRFVLDFNDNLQVSDRPRRLFNAGRVRGRTLEQAAASAYRNPNQRRSGQSLGANEAIFFNWRGSTYLSVNDTTRGYSANRDLVADITAIRFRSSDVAAGELRVNNYFA